MKDLPVSKDFRIPARPPAPRYWLTLLFLLCALPTGAAIILLAPIGEMPDEPQHIARADGLVSGQIIGHSASGYANPGVNINVSVFSAAVSEIPGNGIDLPLPAPARARARALRWHDGQMFCVTQMVRYFPAFYVPGALGIAAGQSLRISPLHTLFIGRAFALISFLGMGAAALQFARFGRPLLFAVLTLPLSLYLASSFNQDGPMIAAAALAAALLTQPRLGPNPAWLAALFLLTLIASAKAPYGWLLLLCLAPLARGGFFKRLGLIALAAAFPAIWQLAVRRANAWLWARPAYHPGPLWPGSQTVWLTATNVRDNIDVLRAHPAAAVWLPLKTLIVDLTATWHQMEGTIGWGLPLEPWQNAGWLLALAAALSGVVLRGGLVPHRQDCALSLLLLAATFFSVALSAYVTFTNVGDDIIVGFNGRYLVPLLPFLLFALPGLGRRLEARRISRQIAGAARTAVWLPAAVMATIDVYALPARIFHVFGMVGP